MLAQREDATSSDSPTDADAAEQPSTLAKDDAFHVLQNSRRRAVLRYLLARPDQDEFRMRDVAEAVAAFEHDTTVQQLSSDERQRVYIALYQSHLPKLDEHDVIAYNQSRGVIEPTPMLEVLDPYLEDGLDVETTSFVVDGAESSGAQRTENSEEGVVGAISNIIGE